MSAGEADSKVKIALIEAAKGVSIAVIAAIGGYYAAPRGGADNGGGGQPGPAAQDSRVVETVRATLGDDEITAQNIGQRLRPFAAAKRELDEYKDSFLFDLFLLELRVRDRPLQPRLLEGEDRAYNRRIQTALSVIGALPEGATVDDDPQRTHQRLVAFQQQYNGKLNEESGLDLSCAPPGESHPPRYLCPPGFLGPRTVGAIRDWYRLGSP